MARFGGLTHPTPPGSPYYPEGTNGIARGLIEGYTNTISGFFENLASGTQGASGFLGVYPQPVGAVNVGFRNITPHIRPSDIVISNDSDGIVE